MKNTILSMLVVAVMAAAAVAQSTAPEPTPTQSTPAQSTPAQSTPAQSTPAVTSAPQPGAARGQDAAGQAQNATQFPAGTVIPVELSKSVDSKKAKAGDKVEAKIPIDLLSHGKVVIAKNTKVIGHVTEAKAHSKESPDAMVAIAFDRVSMKDGHDVPIQAAVQAIARPLQAGAASTGGMDNSGGMPSAGAPTSTGGGGGMGGARAAERPATYPSGPATGTDPSSPQGSTVAPLGPTSQGVVGMKGVSLKAAGQASVISSETDNVHLDSGTQMMLRTQ